jgi:hypothetical protein
MAAPAMRRGLPIAAILAGNGVLCFSARLEALEDRMADLDRAL